MITETVNRIHSKWDSYCALIDTPNDFNFGWSEVNSVLYAMCKSGLENCEPNIIASRLIMIGKTYSATLERNHPDLDISTDMLYYRVSNLEIWQTIANEIKNLNPEDAEDIISIHDRVVNSICDCNNILNRKTSLVSKFLHFHKPDCFYIYDDRTKRAVHFLYPERETIPYDIEALSSTAYAKHFYKVNCIKNEIDPLLSPREIDNFLMYVYHHGVN